MVQFWTFLLFETTSVSCTRPTRASLYWAGRLKAPPTFLEHLSLTDCFMLRLFSLISFVCVSLVCTSLLAWSLCLCLSAHLVLFCTITPFLYLVLTCVCVGEFPLFPYLQLFSLTKVHKGNGIVFGPLWAPYFNPWILQHFHPTSAPLQVSRAHRMMGVH